jgi:hypothetical protein
LSLSSLHIFVMMASRRKLQKGRIEENLSTCLRILVRSSASPTIDRSAFDVMSPKEVCECLGVSLHVVSRKR